MPPRRVTQATPAVEDESFARAGQERERQVEGNDPLERIMAQVRSLSENVQGMRENLRGEILNEVREEMMARQAVPPSPPREAERSRRQEVPMRREEGDVVTRFRKEHPPRFKGGAEPLAAEHWL